VLVGSAIILKKGGKTYVQRPWMHPCQSVSPRTYWWLPEKPTSVVIALSTSRTVVSVWTRFLNNGLRWGGVSLSWKDIWWRKHGYIKQLIMGSRK